MKANKVLIKAHPTDAGFDIESDMDITIYPYTNAVVSTGLKVSIPKGYYGQISSRSGLGFNHDIIAFNGVIDCGYHGEIKVKLFNMGDVVYRVKKGNRIAQLIIIPISMGQVECVHESEFNDSERDSKGFGSTGV